MPPDPLPCQHHVRFSRSLVFGYSQSRPPACGLFPGARHRPRQPRTAVMYAADPAPGRPPASGLVPLTNAAWLSCVVREPTTFFKGRPTWLHKTQNQQPLSGPATSTRPSGRTGERKDLSSPSPFHGRIRTLKATGRLHRLTA